MTVTTDTLKPVPSLEEVFKDHGPRIFTLARRLLGNDADAEDVTQEVLLDVFRKGDSFRGDATFATWLCLSTLRLCEQAASTLPCSLAACRCPLRCSVWN